MGADITQFNDVRHVREMWESAAKEKHPFLLGEFAVGNLLVTARTYSINGELTAIAGHVGIITNVDVPSFIHASAEAGRVEERPLRTLSTVLGCIAIKA